MVCPLGSRIFDPETSVVYGKAREGRDVARVRRSKQAGCAPVAKAPIAREFDVAHSTITRDIREWSGDQIQLCPTCFRPTRNDDRDSIAEVHKKRRVENPLTDAANSRRAAIRARRDELPRVRADLGVFVNDRDDEDPTDGSHTRSSCHPRCSN